MPAWGRLDDVYHGEKAWCEFTAEGDKRPTARSYNYLPKESGEEPNDYAVRLKQSVFVDKFAQSVRDFVGLVFNNGLRFVGVPDAVMAAWENLDGDGLSGNRLLSQIALKSLRLGHSFVLIDHPGPDPTVRSLLEHRQSKRHPYWVDIHPLQVLNWRVVRRGTAHKLMQVNIELEQTVADGAYGEKTERRYLALRPGEWMLQRVVQKDREHQPYAEVLDAGLMGRVVRGRVVPFDHIPLTCIYGGDRQGFFKSNPTLRTLADLNVQHYQVKSDHRQKIHLCCFPQAARVGGDGEDLVLGPKTIVDVPIGGSFSWAEPSSASLAMSRVDLLDLEREMDFLGADYLVKPGDRQAAATTQVQAAKIESELYLFASDLAEGVNDCLRHHAAYLGLDGGGRVELNTKFFEQVAHDPQLLQVFYQMREGGDLTSQDLLRLARDRNYFPETFIPDALKEAGSTDETVTTTR